ncbi:MAG: hypothetical protein K8R90_05285 [Candidatus Cloacimonetes bacterium]|nr:hypothetical protein [Candidatus Cloacimonadota bacterium]
MESNEKTLAQKIRDYIDLSRQRLTKAEEVAHPFRKALTAAYSDGANDALDRLVKVIAEHEANKLEALLGRPQ